MGYMISQFLKSINCLLGVSSQISMENTILQLEWSLHVAVKHIYLVLPEWPYQQCNHQHKFLYVCMAACQTSDPWQSCHWTRNSLVIEQID